jgi:hypothetical protein
MKRLAIVAVLLASCATKNGGQAPPPVSTGEAPVVQPKVTKAADLIDHAGDSTDTAVAVPGDVQDDGFKFENEWIYGRIGRFRRTGGGVGQLNGRRYDVIDVITPSGEKHKFYFDITEAWNNWKPEPPKL